MAARDMTFSSLLIVIVVISGMFAGSLHFIQGMNTGYAEQIDERSSEFNSTLSKMGEIETSVETSQSTVNESESTFSDQLGTIFTGMPKFITILSDAVKQSGDIIGEIAEFGGLPEWFVSMILISIFVIVGGLFLSVIFNRRI